MVRKLLLKAPLKPLCKCIQNRKFHEFRHSPTQGGGASVETRSIALDFHSLGFPTPQPRLGSDGLVDRKEGQRPPVYLRNQTPIRCLD